MRRAGVRSSVRSGTEREHGPAPYRQPARVRPDRRTPQYCLGRTPTGSRDAPPPRFHGGLLPRTHPRGAMIPETDAAPRPLANPAPLRLEGRNGEVAEWSKAHAWKACRRETVSRVRIPVSPPPTPVFLVHPPFHNNFRR